MPIKFSPKYKINNQIAKALMRIEAVKETIVLLPITPQVIKNLRKTARLQTTHYSTMIEGNRLDQDQIQNLVEHDQHITGRERDEREVIGYFNALDEVDRIIKQGESISEKVIKRLHCLVMNSGKRSRIKYTPYRDGQNVIKDGRTGEIVYMPPEAKDVDPLMKSLVDWLDNCKGNGIPTPVSASILHYQFATIHPYYDGNGRTARLLTTLLLHQDGYDLKGLYSLEEYYAKDLNRYYNTISIGPSHNYYMGRQDADITEWIEYFCEGMAQAFEKVKDQAQLASSSKEHDKTSILKKLNKRQKIVLELFQESEEITASDVGSILKLKPRTARNICSSWVESGFLMVTDSSKKARKYKLSSDICNGLKDRVT